MPPTSSPVPRLPSCSVCCLHRPHHRQRSPLRHHRTSNQDEREGGHLVGLWAMSSPHLATTSPPIDSDQQRQGSASPRLPSCPLRPLPRPLSLCQVVRVGQRTNHGGRFPPAHPVDPLHPCRGASAYWRTPPERRRAAVSHTRAARLLGKKVCFGIFCAVVSL